MPIPGQASRKANAGIITQAFCLLLLSQFSIRSSMGHACDVVRSG
jgi:hypothetical protein